MSVFVFFKTGYEDADVQDFDTREQAAKWIADETDNNLNGAYNGFQVIGVVEGTFLGCNIKQRGTVVTFD